MATVGISHGDLTGLRTWSKNPMKKFAMEERNSEFRGCDNHWNTSSSSANSAIDASCMVSAIDPDQDGLWREEIQRKCAKLAQTLEKRLRALNSGDPGLTLKFSSDLPKRISEKIADVASSEPCGLRACCVHLRLLHEDLACALLNDMNDEDGRYKSRAEKSASWHVTPNTAIQHELNESKSLDFCSLPNMDASLTGRLSFDDAKRPGNASQQQRRLRKSFSSPAELPILSGASKLRVPCADLGCLDLCDSCSVPTFEVYVYLVPAMTWIWRVRKLFAPPIKPDAQSNSKSTITLAPDFTLVKRKLYRTRNNAFEVFRCQIPTSAN